jgi:putative flippase GtrA
MLSFVNIGGRCSSLAKSISMAVGLIIGYLFSMKWVGAQENKPDILE